MFLSFFGKAAAWSSTVWLMFRAVPASAQIIAEIPGCLDDDGMSAFITGRIHAQCIPYFIANLITILFGLVGIFFVINIMVAGYQIVLGATGAFGGDDAGKQRLKWSIIGFVVTACSYLILELVLTVLVRVA